MARLLPAVAALALILAVGVFAAACSQRQDYSAAATAAPSAPASAASSPQAAGSPTVAAPTPDTSGSAAKPDTQYVDALKAAEAALPRSLISGNKLGSDDAPLKMLTFVDFQCPYCLKFAATQEPTIIKEYVETGKLQIIAQMFPILGQESVLAAVGGQCAAAQEKFWDYYDGLYIAQAQLGQVSDEKLNVGRFTRESLAGYATGDGIDAAAFADCLADPAMLAAVQDAVNTGRSFGITGTPGFVINGVSHGSGAPASLDDWRQILDDALRAGPAATPTGGSAA